MKFRRICLFLLSCILAVGSFSLTAGAVEVQDGEIVHLQDLESELLEPDSFEDSNNNVEPRASARIDTTILSKKIKTASGSVSLEAGETVTFNCTYSPSSASVDFGLIDSSGRFHYINVTGGSINKTIQVSERGSYTLAVRNNSSNTVSVVGFVNY